MQTSPTQPVASTAYLLFRVAAERYALASASVREIIRWRLPTPVPGAPPLLPGVINQRGQILAIIDLRLLLGLVAAAPDRATRLIWVHHSGIDAALLVDAVDDLIAIEPSQIEPPPVHVAGPAQRVIHALYRHHDQPVAILDPAALFALVQEAA
ncbi:chemotaxis protein CheW [uncultured Chloroflexus sp.]|uniref:chemotaxis protein CheW n=1 Tax=uncultured Chloroflexus sp. TaxID=214040 RepID=UPI002616E17B|nr:chemotaxis protein CheW [uncultured Chloroflexus sp.]